MKLVNKLAIVATMMASANAMALQSMDDEALSATTGQDGITLKVFSPGITIDQLLIHDNDGLNLGASIGTQVVNPVYQPVVTAQNDLRNARLAVGGALQAYQTALTAAAGDEADPNVVAAAATVAGARVAEQSAYDAYIDQKNLHSTTPRTVAGSNNLGGTETAGAIIIKDVFVGKAVDEPLTKALAVVKIDTDGGVATDGSEATLNVNIDLAKTDIRVGSISVGKSNANVLNGARRGAVEHADNVILENLNLSLGTTSLNVQLGHQPQGALIVLDGTVTGGLTIDGLKLIDKGGVSAATAAYGGAGAVNGTLTLDSIKLTSAASQNLNAGLKIGIDQNLGLALTLSNANVDTYISGIHLGNTPSIGDVEIQGLDLGGTTLFVHGH